MAQHLPIFTNGENTDAEVTHIQDQEDDKTGERTLDFDEPLWVPRISN
jgi:hypothetical protein